jgi:hypothetical protein
MTAFSWRTVLFSTRNDNRLLRPGLAQILPSQALDSSKLRRDFDQLDHTIDRWIMQQTTAA